MIVCGYLERDNEKVLKFHVNNPSFFEISTTLLKRRSLISTAP